MLKRRTYYKKIIGLNAHIYIATHILDADALMLLWGTLLYVFDNSILQPLQKHWEAVWEWCLCSSMYSYSCYCCFYYYFRTSQFSTIENHFSSSFDGYFSFCRITKFSSLIFQLQWPGFKLFGLQRGSKIFVLLPNVKGNHSGVIFFSFEFFSCDLNYSYGFPSKYLPVLKISKFQNTLCWKMLKSSVL